MGSGEGVGSGAERPLVVFGAGGSVPREAPGRYRRPGGEEVLGAGVGVGLCFPPAAGCSPEGQNPLSSSRTWFSKCRYQLEVNAVAVVIPERPP